MCPSSTVIIVRTTESNGTLYDDDLTLTVFLDNLDAVSNNMTIVN